MESLRMIDEDEWPNLTNLPDYQSTAMPDPNFYHPIDYVHELGAWLRDYTVRQRHQRITNKREQEQARRNQTMTF